MKKLLSCLLTSLFLWNCTPSEKDKNTNIEKCQYTKEKNPVEVIILKESTFKKEMVSTGKLFAPRKGNLKFRTSGVVNKLFVKNGQIVSTDDTIDTLDNFEQAQSYEYSYIRFGLARITTKEG